MTAALRSQNYEIHPPYNQLRRISYPQSQAMSNMPGARPVHEPHRWHSVFLPSSLTLYLVMYCYIPYMNMRCHKY